MEDEDERGKRRGRRSRDGGKEAITVFGCHLESKHELVHVAHLGFAALPKDLVLQDVVEIDVVGEVPDTILCLSPPVRGQFPVPSLGGIATVPGVRHHLRVTVLVEVRLKTGAERTDQKKKSKTVGIDNNTSKGS